MTALAGGPVTVYGFSSGATLALLAAEAGVPIARLALLEPPLFDEPDPQFTLRDEGLRRVGEDLDAAGDWYITDIVGVPPEVLAQLPARTDEDRRNIPTIAHELEFLPGTPACRFTDVEQPVLLMASNATASVIYEFAEALKAALPNATYQVLPGEWHGVDDVTLTDAIAAFMSEGVAGATTNGGPGLT